MFDRITFDKNILGGKACIRGMRLSVSNIVGQIAHGETIEEVLYNYPDLERDDIDQCLAYADTIVDTPCIIECDWSNFVDSRS